MYWENHSKRETNISRASASTALMRHNTSKTNSNLVTEALVAAEADGLNGHGLSRLPSYCAQAASGKVDGHAAPTVLLVANATIRVDVKICSSSMLSGVAECNFL